MVLNVVHIDDPELMKKLGEILPGDYKDPELTAILAFALALHFSPATRNAAINFLKVTMEIAMAEIERHPGDED